MRSATVSYTGNGSSQSITGVGFKPDLVMITNGGDETVFTIATVQPDKTINLGQDNTTSGQFSGGITSLDADGFSVGSDGRVNASGVTYYAVCVARTGTANFGEGTYVGNGVDNRSITTEIAQPTIAIVKAQSGTLIVNMRGVWKTESLADPNSSEFVVSSGGFRTNAIQDLEANGFQIGTDHRVNRSGFSYWYFVMKDLSGYIAQGSFVGDGTTDRLINIGFTPQVVLQHSGNTGSIAQIRFDNFPANSSCGVNGGGFTSTNIRNFETNGFRTSLNSSGTTYYWIAWGAGFLPPEAHTGYPRRIRAHPTDTKMLVAEGRNTTSDDGLIFISEDGGTTWTRKGRGGNNKDGLSLAIGYINNNAAGHIITGITDTDAGNTIRWMLSKDNGSTWTEILSYDDSGTRAIDVQAHGDRIWLLSDYRLYQINDNQAAGTPTLIANANSGGSGPEAGTATYQAIAFDKENEYLYLATSSGKIWRRRTSDASPSWTEFSTTMQDDLGYLAIGMKLGMLVLPK